MKPNFISINWGGGGRNISSLLIAMLTLLLTSLGTYTAHAQTDITIEVDNDNPVEGCDQLTFTVKLCNDNAQYRDATVRVYQMGYFEITDIGDFGYYQPGSTKENSYVHKFISQMAPYDCQELTFIAMAMSQIQNIPNEVEAKVQFVLNGQNDNQEDAVQVSSQGYIVLDGRTTPLLYSDAVEDEILPEGSLTCDQLVPHKIFRITVLGTFEVDDQFCFGNPSYGSIIMGDDAEIIVKQNAILRINGKVEGCSGMWRQIRVNTGGKLVFNNHSLLTGVIKDGARAISLDGGSEAYLQRVNFEDNHVGVYMTNLVSDATAYSDPILTRFSDLKFENNLEGTLKGTIDESLLAESNANPEYSFCGVYVRGGNMINLSSFESDTYNWNRYFDLPNGIVTVNANVIVGRTHIDGSHQESAISALTGHAILARGNNHLLTVKGESASKPVTIYHCDYGIRALAKMNVYAEHVSGSDYLKGVYSTGVSPNLTIKVQDCNFDEVAEVGLHHRGYGHLDYTRNVLGIDGGVTSQGGSSILVGEGILATPVLYNHLSSDIRDNTIDVNTGSAGITIFNSPVEIHENTINLKYDNVAVINGIGLLNPFNSAVSCNLITGTDYDNQSQTNGIYLAGSSNLAVTCNDVTETGAGIRFFGLNDATEIRANTMDEHLFGLAYGYPSAGSGTYTSPQAFKGNYWPVLNSEDNPSGRYGAIHYSYDQFPVDESKYTVNDSEGKAYLPKWNAVSTWFFPDEGSANQNCSESSTLICLNGIGAYRPLVPDALDEWIMQDSLNHAAWQANGIRHLLRRFASNTLLLQDSTFYVYHTSVLSSDEAAWHDVAESIRTAWKVDSALQMSFEQHRSNLDALTAALFMAMDSLVYASNDTDSTYWAGQLDTALLDYRAEFVVWSPIADSIDQIAMDRLDSIWMKYH